MRLKKNPTNIIKSSDYVEMPDHKIVMHFNAGCKHLPLYNVKILQGFNAQCDHYVLMV